MDSHKQQVDSLQDKQPNNNIVIKILKKYGSTITSHIEKKEEEQVKCDLALCSFEDEDEWYIDNSCSNQIFGDKNKFESLKKNKERR